MAPWPVTPSPAGPSEKTADTLVGADAVGADAAAGTAATAVATAPRLAAIEAKTPLTRLALSSAEESDGELQWNECLQGLLRGRERAAADERDGAERCPVAVAAVNLRHCASGDTRELADATQQLKRIFGSETSRPDVLCVQDAVEGIATKVLASSGYRRLVSSAGAAWAQSAEEAFYAVHCAGAGSRSPGAGPGPFRDGGPRIAHEIYVQAEGSDWEAVDFGVARISSEIALETVVGSHPGEPRALASRCVAWAKLLHRNRLAGPFVYVLSVQLSGASPLEEGCFAGSLAEERRLQLGRALEAPFRDLVDAGSGAPLMAEGFGVLVGDFGTLAMDPEDSTAGPPLRLPLPTDLLRTGLSDEELTRHFKAYSAAPFSALRAHDWKRVSAGGDGLPSAAGQAQLAGRAVLAVARWPKIGGDRGFPRLLETLPPDRAGEALKATFSIRLSPLPEERLSIPRQLHQSDMKHVSPGTTPSTPLASYAELSCAPLTMASTGVSHSAGQQVPAPGGGRSGNGRSYLAHIARTSATNAAQVGSRRAALRREYEELSHERCAERAAAEDLQRRLQSEMCELRDQCHEQGQTVGSLAQCLADARCAVTSELQEAAAVRAALGGELMSEESQRMALEAARRGEEAQVEARVEGAEQELQTMLGLRDQLMSQLRASKRQQMELQDHIAAERLGRQELEEAGQHEVESLSEHNERAQQKMLEESQLQKERERAEEQGRQKLETMFRESVEQQEQESALLSRLEEARAARMRLQTRLLLAPHYRDMEDLRIHSLELDEECLQTKEASQRSLAARGFCSSEREALEEHFEQIRVATCEREGNLRGLVVQRRQLEEELEEVRERLMRLQHGRSPEDSEVLRLNRERSELARQIEAQEEIQKTMQAELETPRRSKGLFFCLRRGAAPAARTRAASPKRASQSTRGRISGSSSPPAQGLSGQEDGLPSRQPSGLASWDLARRPSGLETWDSAGLTSDSSPRLASGPMASPSARPSHEEAILSDVV